MVSVSVVAALALAAMATATPLTQRLTARDDCSGDTSSEDGVEAIFSSVVPIGWLDEMLTTFPNGENDWVDKMWDFAFPDEGTSPLSGCGFIDSDCTIDTNCQDYKTPQAYWVLTSVQRLHSKLDVIHDQLLWNGWLDGLSIDQIVSDFTTPPPDLTWAKWVSAALAMVGGIGTGFDWSKPLRGMIGFASGAMNAVSMSPEASSQIDAQSVENTLSNLVGSAGNYVSSILANATGNGDATTLPIYTTSTFQYATSRFFNDPSILLDENKDNSTFFSAWNAFIPMIEQKLVVSAMQALDYVLIADAQYTNEGDCTANEGALWLQGRSQQQCFYLTKPQSCGDTNQPLSCADDNWLMQGSGQPNSMGTTIYDNLTKKYNFDLTALYSAFIDCAINGNGEVDTTVSVPNYPQYFRCFFNLAAQNGNWDDPLDGTDWYLMRFDPL